MMRKLLLILLMFAAAHSRAQFLEGFEGDNLPDMTTGAWNLNSGTWNISDNGIGTSYSWQSTDLVTDPPFVFEGTKAAYVNRENIGLGNTGEDWLVTPAVTTVTANTRLEFFTRTVINGDQGSLYQIRVSTTSQTDHTSFQPLESWSETSVSSVFNIYSQKTVPLGQFAGQTIYIAFVKVYTQPTASLGGDRWLIDRVMVGETSTIYNQVSGMIRFGNACGENNPFSVTLNTAPNPAYMFLGYMNQSIYSVITHDNDITISIPSPLPYVTVTPPSYTFDFAAQGNNQIANFCLDTDGGDHNNISVTIFPRAAIPGMLHNCSLLIKNFGTVPATGTVTLTYDNSKLDLANLGGGVLLGGNMIQYSFADIPPISEIYRHVQFIVHTPTNPLPANIGDVLNYSAQAVITATDEVPADNSATASRTIGGSYDPNEKYVAEGATITQAQTQNFLHYTVRFQNTGNSAASFVKISDAISTDLDINTLQILDASHGFRTVRSGNNIDFVFDNINLPAQSVDDLASQGFVTYAIKPVNGIAVGTAISNTADIYFDFNYPITTNTVTTTVTGLGIGDFNLAQKIGLYPNPANSLVSISVEEGVSIESVSVFNMLGQKIKTVAGAQMSVDISDIHSGSYLVQITTDKGKTTKKLIKL